MTMKQEAVILIVDDEPTARQATEMLLLHQGYTLHFAANGPEALAQAAEVAPDVILLDVMMPGMDGFTVCRALKTAVAHQHIPIVLVTALDSKEDLARCLDAGADDFIHKPVNGLELRARVRSMLRIKQRHDGLQTLLRLRQDLSNMIMHDVRTPLTTITLYCDLLAASVSNDGQGMLQTINTQVARLNSFVTDMLLMARLEDGRLVVMPTAVNLNALLHIAYLAYEPLAAQKSVMLDLALPDPPIVADLDATLWQRVVDNLLANALKFSPDNGRIELRLERATPGQFRLHVSDEGPGVPPEHRETIFDPLKLAAAGRRDVQQVGLGLAFCRMVVEAHHGRLAVTDNTPHGATFTVEM